MGKNKLIYIVVTLPPLIGFLWQSIQNPIRIPLSITSFSMTDYK